MSDIKRGYYYDEEGSRFVCLLCKTCYEKGDIVSFKEKLVDAEKAMKIHIGEEHGSVFEALISSDRKRTGLTDVQRNLMSCFYNGMTDKEISVQTGIQLSTVRYQRFNLREKAKQAKIFLVLSELMEEKMKSPSVMPQIHEGATMVDDRYMITDAEAEKVIKLNFLSLNPLVLRNFPAKEKKKLVILRMIAKEFESDRKYTEKEINEILKPIFDDYVTIRRYLIEYGFMARTQSCTEYWLR